MLAGGGGIPGSVFRGMGLNVVVGLGQHAWGGGQSWLTLATPGGTLPLPATPDRLLCQLKKCRKLTKILMLLSSS